MKCKILMFAKNTHRPLPLKHDLKNLLEHSTMVKVQWKYPLCIVICN